MTTPSFFQIKNPLCDAPCHFILIAERVIHQSHLPPTMTSQCHSAFYKLHRTGIIGGEVVVISATKLWEM